MCWLSYGTWLFCFYCFMQKWRSWGESIVSENKALTVHYAAWQRCKLSLNWILTIVHENLTLVTTLNISKDAFFNHPLQKIPKIITELYVWMIFSVLACSSSHTRRLRLKQGVGTLSQELFGLPFSLFKEIFWEL